MSMGMIKLFDIYVEITDTVSVKGSRCSVNMLDFIGTAKGAHFCGRVIGKGTDTQFITDGRMILSARYMLEGRDADGRDCRIFIENNGSFEDGFVPRMVTDSRALSRFENSRLRAEIGSTEKGVTVSVFAEEEI